MKTKSIIYALSVILLVVLVESFIKLRTAPVKLKEENVTYSLEGLTFDGYIAYVEDMKGKRPAVLVVHEWWGNNDYSKMRARELAKLGYIAMAVDMYGNGKIAANPAEAKELATPFYTNPKLAKSRLDAAINKIKQYKQTDPDKIVAVGYCFGGSVVLNNARLGSELKGVVCFHGGLIGAPADKNLLKTKILVCQGGSDQFVSQKDVDLFKHQMDSIGANYVFKVYPNATHAFTNPEATKIGKEFNMPIEYNEMADHKSWDDMKSFFATVFNP
jgi:dienelactone hydrolase